MTIPVKFSTVPPLASDKEEDYTFSQTDKCSLFLCQGGELDIILEDKTYHIRQGDIYISPLLMSIQIKHRSKDLKGVVLTVDIDYILTNTKKTFDPTWSFFIYENPCLSLSKEQYMYIDQLIDALRRRIATMSHQYTTKDHQPRIGDRDGRGTLLRDTEYLFCTPSPATAAQRSEKPCTSEFHGFTLPESPHGTGGNLLRPGTISDTPLFFGDHQREIGHLGPAVDHSHGHCRRQTDASFLRLKYQGDSFRTELLDPILLRQIFQAVCRDFSDRIPKREIGRPKPTVGFRAIIPERE